MMNEILSKILDFFNGPIIPAIISLVGIVLFFLIYSRENKTVNKERKRVQQNLINKATIALPRRTYDVACAGSKDVSACEKIETIDVRACNFLDGENNPIEDIDCYNFFIVHGNSMQYAGIYNGDLLFTPIDFEYRQLLSDNLPKILVLKYRKLEDESIALKAKYKVRRAWHRCNIEEITEHYTIILEKIVNSSPFLKLKRENGYQSDEWMINIDFPNRLQEYAKYSSDGEYPKEFKDVIISTTYDVSQNEIHFSIHPVSSVVGIVKHSFTLGKKQ